MIEGSKSAVQEDKKLSKRLKIVPELIPLPLWGKSLATVAYYDIKAREIWKKIRVSVFSAAHEHCEVCGSRAEVVHEVWEYDDLRNVQKLVGFKALCQMCNLVVHLGFANVHGVNNVAIEHLCKVNGITSEEAKTLIQASFEEWRRRSFRSWEQDLSWLVENAQSYRITKEEATYLVVKFQELMKKESTNIEALAEVPLVGSQRAKALWKAGIRSIPQLSEVKADDLASNAVLREWARRDTCFFRQLPMIINYAKAIVSGRPIIVGKDLELERLLNGDYCFIDLEYDPSQPFVFIAGVMEKNGAVWQNFAESEKEEGWLIKELVRKIEGKVVITYAGKAADLPILKRSGEKHKVYIPKLVHIDLFYDVILTYRPEKQRIYLPLKPLTEKSVAWFFGYREPENLIISDGFEALIYFREYLRKHDQQIKQELLRYNRADLDRAKLVFEKIISLFQGAEY